jgi:hypothetical protein
MSHTNSPTISGDAGREGGLVDKQHRMQQTRARRVSPRLTHVAGACSWSACKHGIISEPIFSETLKTTICIKRPNSFQIAYGGKKALFVRQGLNPGQAPASRVATLYTIKTGLISMASLRLPRCTANLTQSSMSPSGTDDRCCL